MTTDTKTHFSQAEVNRILAAERREMEMKISEAEVTRGQRLADLDELLDLHGFVRADDESTEQAAARLLADLQSQNDAFDGAHLTSVAEITSKHAEEIAPLRDRAAKVETRLTEVEITTALVNAARLAKAYNPDQIVTLLRPNTHQLGNGEIVLTDVLPRALQSPLEAIEFLKDAQPNLFEGGL